MDTHDDEDTDTCHSMDELNICDENKDFISDLPDQILVKILSFLPIKDAIRTVLLRRFNDLWRCVPILDLNSCLYHNCEEEHFPPDYHNEKFVDIIHHVLNLHDSGTLEKLCLKFCFEFSFSKNESLIDDDNDDPNSDIGELLGWEKGTADQIEKLIFYSMSKNVKVLDINLKGCAWVDPREHYNLPDVFSSNYLTDLLLAACDIRSCRTINLKSLKVLLLDEVSLSDEIMAEVLVGCPFLEDLSLIECYGLGILKCENPNLKKVVLILAMEEFLIVSCPYVLSLEIDGWLERALLLDVSSVVDASIFFRCRFGCEQRWYSDVRWLLYMISKCKTFSPCTSIILVFTIWNLINARCPSFEWKNLILKLSLTKWHHPGLSLLYRNSQSLETLTMYIYPGQTYIFETKEAEWIHAYDFDGESYWESQEATFPCLESIKLYGYVNEPYVIEMVKFLLKNASRLQKLVISTKESFKPNREDGCFWGPIERQKDHFTDEQLLELSQKFEKLHRASPKAMVYFS